MSDHEQYNQALKVLEAVKAGNYNDNRKLRTSMRHFSGARGEESSVMEGTWNLLWAIPMFAPAPPRNHVHFEMSFLDHHDLHMRRYTLLIKPEYTRIIWNGVRQHRKYDLAKSNKDRYDVLAWLIERWRNGEKKNAQLDRDGDVVMKGVRYTKKNGSIIKANVASQILHNHPKRRITRRVEKPYKPSPLGRHVQTVSLSEQHDNA